MPPIRKHLARKKYSGEYNLPGHEFTGPGTDICKRIYDMPLSAVDAAAKAHDIDYANPNKLTWEADKQFIKDTQKAPVYTTQNNSLKLAFITEELLNNVYSQEKQQTIQTTKKPKQKDGVLYLKCTKTYD
uniref:Phospholipase A2-like domain-containing protein n=1 Tax=Octopus bimaculoides TaxID=37653 RepID=A0A0L8FWZ4_OCTBM